MAKDNEHPIEDQIVKLGKAEDKLLHDILFGGIGSKINVNDFFSRPRIDCPDFVDALLSAKEEIKTGINYLEKFLKNLPDPALYSLNFPLNCRCLDANEKIYFGKDNERYVDLGFKIKTKRKQTGEFTSQSELGEKFTHNMEFSEGYTVNETELKSLVFFLEKRVNEENYFVNEEIGFIQKTGSFLRINELSAVYFKQKYVEIAGDFNAQICQKLRDAEYILDQGIKKSVNVIQAVDAVQNKCLQSLFDEKKRYLEGLLAQEGERLHTEIENYAQSFVKRYGERELELEKKYEAKFKELDAEREASNCCWAKREHELAQELEKLRVEGEKQRAVFAQRMRDLDVLMSSRNLDLKQEDKYP